MRIMAALERSCEPDVPACQQQLCIIGCLPHVNACLLPSRPPTLLPARRPTTPAVGLSRGRFCSDSGGPTARVRPANTLLPRATSRRDPRSDIYGVVRYNKQRRSNEPPVNREISIPRSRIGSFVVAREDEPRSPSFITTFDSCGGGRGGVRFFRARLGETATRSIGYEWRTWWLFLQFVENGLLAHFDCYLKSTAVPMELSMLSIPLY